MKDLNGNDIDIEISLTSSFARDYVDFYESMPQPKYQPRRRIPAPARPSKKWIKKLETYTDIKEILSPYYKNYMDHFKLKPENIHVCKFTPYDGVHLWANIIHVFVNGRWILRPRWRVPSIETKTCFFCGEKL